MKFKSLLFAALTLCAFNAWADVAPWVGSTLNGAPCNGGGQGYGPYDYSRRAFIDPYNLNIVEGAHFTPEVEGLIRGNRGTLEGDLNYTLRAWPNHHRALLSIIKFQINVNNKIQIGPNGKLDKLATPPECYLQRAMHFSPEDAVVYSLYGHYLRKMGRLEDAVKYYEKALKLEPENAKFAYSFSLLLIDLKRYEEAVKYAKVAYQRKNTPKGLRQKLEKLGVWNETNPNSSVNDDVPISESDDE